MNLNIEYNALYYINDKLLRQKDSADLLKSLLWFLHSYRRGQLLLGRQLEAFSFAGRMFG